MQHAPQVPRPFGPYTLLRRLAVGGMAEIYVAKTRGLGGFEKLVALKLVHPHLSADPHFVRMLIDEAKILVLLSHANVAQVFDLGCIDGTYYISLEYVEGVDIHGLQKIAAKVSQQLPIPVCCYIVAEMLQGLDYAHRKRDAAGKPLNIVHRDVSPQNVLISHSGEIKLIDFGIAKTSLRVEGTEVGVIKGKYYYMSPEQAWADPIDRRSDIFSTGIVLHEMLTGRMLYTARSIPELIAKVRAAEIPSPSALRPEVPEALSQIVIKALAPDASERYPSALDMGEALRDFLYETAPAFNAGRLAQFVAQLLEAERRAAAAEPTTADSTGSLRALTRSEYVRSGSSVIIALQDAAVATRAEVHARAVPPREGPFGEPPGAQRISGWPLEEAGEAAGEDPTEQWREQPQALAMLTQAGPPDDGEPTGQYRARHAQAMAGITAGHPAQRGSQVPAAPGPSGRPPPHPSLRPPVPRPGGPSLTTPPAFAPPGVPPPTRGAVVPTSPGASFPPAASFPPGAPFPPGASFPPGVTLPGTGALPYAPFPPSSATPRGASFPPGASLPPSAPVSRGPNGRPSLPPMWVDPAGMTKRALVPPPGEAPSLGPIPPSPPVPDFSPEPVFGHAFGNRRWLTVVAGLVLAVLSMLGFRLAGAGKRAPELEIVSVPQGAQVRIQGALQTGVTPLRITGLEEGRTYDLQVQLPGYRPWQASYQGTPGAVQHIAVLQPITGELQVVSTPSGADVFLDDVSIGRTPLRVSSLTVGRRVRLRVSAPGYAEAKREITIDERNLKSTESFTLSAQAAPRR